MRNRTMTVLTAGAVILLAACGGSAEPESAGPPADEKTPVADGHFRTVIASDPGNLDPLMTVLALTRWVTTFMYDSLIFIDSDGTVEPYLAESWEVDLNQVTYTLKEGIACSDGTPLTASDVADNFSFVTDPANQSPQLGLWVQPGVTATADDDARTVTLSSEQPDPFLLQGTGLMQIVCAAGTADRSSLAEGSAGTGMFELTDAVPGDHYTFERRDEYSWGPSGASASDPGTPKTVTLHVVANETTAVNMFLAGELNIVQAEGPDVARLEQSGADTIDTSALFSELIFNQAEGRPGADPAVRKALTQAVDLSALGAVLTDGRGKPPTGLGVLDPKTCPTDTVSGNIPGHDPQAAAALLDEAGWVAGANGIRAKDGRPLQLSLLHLPELGAGVSSGAELLAEQWEAVGAKVTLRSITQAQVNEVLFGTGDWDAVLMRVTVAFPTQLLPFFSGPVPPEGTNFAHIDNQEYSKLTEQAAQLTVDEGCPLWEDADRALISDADVVPIVDSVAPWFLEGAEVRLLANNPSPPTIRLNE